MKKLISVLLCLTLLMPVAAIPARAATQKTSAPKKTAVDGNDLRSAFVEGENSLILFVTGIGQSFSYLFDESYVADGAFENGTLQDPENYASLIAEGKYSTRWNLFNSFDEAFNDKNVVKAAAKTVAGLLVSPFLRRNIVKQETVDTLVKGLFKFNIIDENGKIDDRVVTPRYTMPLADYPGVYDANGNFESEAKHRFYTSIPCAEIGKELLGDNYEEYLYCYNYCAFSYTSDNVEGLHDYIEEVLKTNRVGAKDVILVPMSMGASVVSAYLDKYPTAEQNHVRRVVSIVGCWDGSDVVTDLIFKRYADNSADLFYNGVIADLVGEPWGYLINFILRLFPKAALRNFIDEAIGSIAENILLGTPSLLALVPDYAYDEVRPLIKNEAVLEQTDAYYKTQSTLKERLKKLSDEEGIEVSFIAGYGLPYGAITSDYNAFAFMASAEKTNSDEIINISSTAPGTEYVAYNGSFADTQGRTLSPDGTIDITNTYNKNATWFFNKQKHELEYNNTAIALALHLALGDIKTVEDCDDPETDGYYYPQFNEARNLRDLKKNYIPALESFCRATGHTLTADEQAVYDKVTAMTNTTVNDPEYDNAVIEEFYNMLVDIGVYPAPTAKKTGNVLTGIFKAGNDMTYKLFGAKGFLDFSTPTC